MTRMQPNKSQQHSRRRFIRNLSMASAILLSGRIQLLSAAEVQELRNKVRLRFVVASDAHFGQKGTNYEELLEKITRQINLFHKTNSLDFCVINGDIIHNDKSMLPLAKKQLEVLNMPWYVSRGNHDMVSEQFWKETWGMDLNFETVIKDSAILIGDTSNEMGTYLPPNLIWLKESLEKHKHKKQVFLFLHIPQAKWTVNGIDTPAFFELISQYPNVRAVFHGHEHDQDGVKMHGSLPFFFDAHIGGNWGTDYKGFRVVELIADERLITYMMNPVEKLYEMAY